MGHVSYYDVHSGTMRIIVETLGEGGGRGLLLHQRVQAIASSNSNGVMYGDNNGCGAGAWGGEGVLD